jgi:predicted DNA-binding protein
MQYYILHIYVISEVKMTRGITTSIRLELGLSEKLERAAHNLHRGKNWIISEAVSMYLEQLESSSLVQEARRQSLLASKEQNQDTDLWEINNDQEGWKA